MRRAIFTSTLNALSGDPDEVLFNIKEQLPFEIPITNRSNTQATVIALHKLYRFNQLPETYFIKRPKLPAGPQALNETLKYYFSIKKSKALKKLSLYRSELKKYYELDRKLPAAYYQLPPEKPRLPPLPNTYQKLDRSVRHLFSIDLAKKNSIKTATDHLHKLYNFKYLPNNFIKPKPRLSNESGKIKTQIHFTYPIEDIIVKKFLEIIKYTYQYTLPLPTNIVNANSTDKPVLPNDPEQITEYALTILFTTPRQLIEAAQLLRQHYYFTKIPDHWIDIILRGQQSERTNKDKTKPLLPNTVEDIKQVIYTLHMDVAVTQESEIELPITDHAKVTPTLEFLKKQFFFNGIPNHIINLPPLPEPSWEIFQC
ncbi:hypothetical protein C2G38_2308536 [Gigaspora rosea]|uniref:Uncharacterized protein n=1 Tax=Gigaspora rosea TaxID=44941 RepID=A0A397V9C2_9GLOM|nr:hypothetical protein C2G38_2308536 [Gigaspora rosea]